MQYRMQEGCLTLDGEWQDKSVNVLVPQGLPQGMNLVVSRDVLPLGMGLPDYLQQQKKVFRDELADFRFRMEEVAEIDGRPASLLEFEWDNQGSLVHQLMAVVQEKERILSLTATAPGGMDDSVREVMLTAIKSFTFARDDEAGA